MLVCLVGLPGSGKTTIGRHLARRLGVPFVDTDHVIEERIGCSIREFFEREGEDRFRDIETEVIEDLTLSHEGVLSSGGGAVLRPINRQALRRGRVFYLRATPDELMRRLRHDTQRPLLQVADPLARLRDLFAKRDPLYTEAAHHVIETSRPSVSGLVQAVLDKLGAGDTQNHRSRYPSRPRSDRSQ